MKFLTIFPYTENVHLTKDVGMVPYMLHKYHRYDVHLLCYENGEYPYLEKEVKGLKIIFLKKIFNRPDLDVLYFLFKNYKRFDVVMCFHSLRNSLIWLNTFRFLKGKKAITYLKLDGNDSLLSPNYFKHKLGWWYKKSIQKYTIVSIETKKIHRHISNEWNREVAYIPNGFYDWEDRKKVLFDQKENLIIAVGKIGDTNKSNEILVNAFVKVADKFPDWKLHLIGPIVNNFDHYVLDILNKNPCLKNRIKLMGSIKDKAYLAQQYQRAKIFVHTSKFESFGLVYLEAMQAGCYVLSTDITPAYDITDNEKYGKLFPVDDADALVLLLAQTIPNEELLRKNTQAVQNFVYEKFYWPKIVNKLDTYLQQSRND